MNPLAHTLLAALALILAPLAGPALAEPIDLRLNLEPGQTYRSRVVIEMRTEQEMQGIRQEIGQTLGNDYSYEVLDVDAEGNHRVEVTHDAVWMAMEGPMGDVEFDSRQEPEPEGPMARAFAAMVGDSFEMTLTPAGRVTEVRGVGEMLDRVLAGFEAAGPIELAVQEHLIEQLSDEAVRAQMDTMTAIFPDQPVEVGDTWTVDALEMDFGFPINVDNTFTLQSREGGVAAIALESTMATPPDAEPTEMEGMLMSYEVEGRADGLLRIAEDTGWTRGSEIESRISGHMRIEAPGLPDTVDVPMEITSTTSEAPID